MSLLTSVLSDTHGQHPLIVLQSSIAQSSLPLLRPILTPPSGSKPPKIPHLNLVFCLLYDLSTLLEDPPEHTQIHDYTGRVPGYDDSSADLRDLIITTVKQAPSQPINVVIDAADTLASDIGSPSESYKFLKELLQVVRKHSQNSRLVLHLLRPSLLIPLLTETRFSPSLAHLISHPPVLLTHIATEFLTPPPPASPEVKFWSVFIPISERGVDTEQLVFGSKGEGSGDPNEIVVELVVRSAEGVKKRAVERVLEGWSNADGPCDLAALSSLKSLRMKPSAAQPTSDPTQNVSFNLTLTASQQESRAQVPLPYAHEGKPVSTASRTGAIYYDPDSADDIDDDDPDEDLDI